MRKSVIAFCCLSAVLWAQSKPAAAPAKELIFTNVNVVNTRDGEIFHNMTVVVDHGHIRAVAKVGLIAGGRGLQVINAAGKFLIPGLWDMHVQTGEARAEGWDDKVLYPLFIANGVTGLRDMSDDPELDRERQLIAHGDVLGPQLMPRADFLSPRKAKGWLDAGSNSVAASGPDDHSDLPAGLPRDSFLGSRLSASHSWDPSFSADTLNPALRTTEHLDGIFLACSSQEDELRHERERALANGDTATYTSAEMQAITTYDPQKAHDLFVELATRGTWQVPELVSTEAGASLEAAHLNNDPRLRYVPSEVRQLWDRERPEQGNLQLATLEKRALSDLHLVDSMRRAGMQFLTGTGDPQSYVFPGFSLHDELQLLVKSGFTPLQALQAATFNPALFMAKLDQYGVVEKGHIADLVLLDGNPLEDIGNTRKIAAVVVGGKYYSHEDLHNMLAHVAQLANQSIASAADHVPDSQ